MSFSIEPRILTLRSAVKNNIATKNSNTPELRCSKRIANKRSYDEDSITDEKTKAKSRLNDIKRTKFQFSTFCNKSIPKKEITGNKVVKKQQEFKIVKSKKSGILLRPSDNNDVQTTSSPRPAFENNSRLRVISDVISEQDADMKLNTPSTSRYDLVILGEVQNGDFCPSPQNFDELSIILNKIWDRQQLAELDDDLV